MRLVLVALTATMLLASGCASDPGPRNNVVISQAEEAWTKGPELRQLTIPLGYEAIDWMPLASYVRKPNDNIYRRDFAVTEGSGGLKIILSSELSKPLTARIGEHQLTGTDRGEWGGRLVKITGAKEVMLDSSNVRLLIKAENGVFVFSGVNHFNSGIGYMGAVSSDGVYRRITVLPGTPCSATYDSEMESFIVLTSEGIVLLREVEGNSASMRILAPDDFGFVFSYATSKVCLEDHLYFGTRGGVVRLEKPKIGIYQNSPQWQFMELKKSQ